MKQGDENKEKRISMAINVNGLNLMLTLDWIKKPQAPYQKTPNSAMFYLHEIHLKQRG